MYRIQVNIKDGGEEQWQTLRARFNNLDDAKAIQETCQREWEGILQFRVI